jgi:hypothetical protein
MDIEIKPLTSDFPDDYFVMRKNLNNYGAQHMV